MSGPQFVNLDLNCLDERFASLRLKNPRDLEQLKDSISIEGQIREPLLVSTNVEAGRCIAVDGFKRVWVARQLKWTHLWVQTEQLDAAHAVAAILHCNQSREGLSKLEEAWICHCLCWEHGLTQKAVAKMLRHNEAWVCRRLKLARALDESLKDDVRDGVLSATIASQLSQLQRCNQKPVARAVIEHDLSSRECTQLLELLEKCADQGAVRELLNNPRRYIVPGKNRPKPAIRSDPCLSEEGNRLRSSLLSWQRDCDRLTDQLRRASVADAGVLAPLIQSAAAAGNRAVRQLEATQSAYSVNQPSKPGEPPSAPPAP